MPFSAVNHNHTLSAGWVAGRCGRGVLWVVGAWCGLRGGRGVGCGRGVVGFCGVWVCGFLWFVGVVGFCGRV
jgi:hypothetical protein